MDIELFIERENSTKSIIFNGRAVFELLRQASLNPETVIVVRSGEVLTEKEILHDKDRIELLSVISGG